MKHNILYIMHIDLSPVIVKHLGKKMMSKLLKESPS